MLALERSIYILRIILQHFLNSLLSVLSRQPDVVSRALQTTGRLRSIWNGSPTLVAKAYFDRDCIFAKDPLCGPEFGPSLEAWSRKANSCVTTTSAYSAGMDGQGPYCTL